MARSSIYGNMLQMPDWVFGGDYGDISNLLTKRDQSRANLIQTEQQNEARDLQIEEAKREADIQDEMRKRGIFGPNDKPPTLRDMYGRMRDTAGELGSYEDVIKMQEKIDELDRRQRAEDLDRKAKEALIGKRERQGSGDKANDGEEKGSVTLTDPNGKPVRIKKSEYNKYIDMGFGDPVLGYEPPKAQIPKQPGFLDRMLGGFMGEGEIKPGEKAADKQKELVDNIKEEAAAFAKPSRPPQPGMKWQRNKKTGELREIPA